MGSIFDIFLWNIYRLWKFHSCLGLESRNILVISFCSKGVWKSCWKANWWSFTMGPRSLSRVINRISHRLFAWLRMYSRNPQFRKFDIIMDRAQLGHFRWRHHLLFWAKSWLHWFSVVAVDALLLGSVCAYRWRNRIMSRCGYPAKIHDIRWQSVLHIANHKWWVVHILRIIFTV